ncbi:uncharacterized protein RMCC_5540 [Mycolicibacterium canariasense]|uniref:Uncharacterized protein n=1 Tax=Mycolicibacterium canariasense TaxID=228230 RepID=A0A100WI32_MYCCR|nr:hypothetical protein [Mycolicibacterium canariasense]MCV7213036.1 hypothetical protein [Mycolicibacterium canariasense]GAS98575.1 uncharacterized protein RMCC_5540 [Mycolicibacterium canariasense]
MTIPGDLPIEPRGALLITADASGQVSHFERICVLPVEDYTRYRQAYKQVSGVLFGSIYTYFASSKSLLHSAVMAANQAADAGLIQPNSAPDTFATWLTSLRGTALSLCSSVAYHQDQMLRRIEKAYGEDSNTYSQVAGQFHDLYDGYAGYRFLCRLRNVMVHESMEAVTAAVKQILVGGHIQSRFRVTIDRSFIAQSDMKKAVKTEIVGLRENPDLLELADAITEPLTTVNTAIETLLLDNMSSAFQAVAEFDDLFGGRPGLRAIANSPDDGPGPHVPAYMPWSQQVIDIARRRLQPHP